MLAIGYWAKTGEVVFFCSFVDVVVVVAAAGVVFV